MAIFRPSALVGALSGRVGGAEFVIGRGAPYVRKAQHKIKHQSPSRLDAQAIYTQAVRAWENLTDTQRRTWRALAQIQPLKNRLGLPRTMTGFEAYMRSAIPNIRTIGIAPTVPDEDFTSPPPTGYTFTSTDAADIEFALVGVDPFTNEGNQVFAGFSFSKPAWKSPRIWRLVFSGQLNVSARIELIPTWPADFVLPVTGWTIFLRTRTAYVASFPSAFAETRFVIT